MPGGQEYRLFITVSEDFYEDFAAWAKKLKLNKSQLGNVCVRAGLQQIIQAISPYDAIGPDRLAEIVEALDRRGVIVKDLEEFQKKGGEKGG
jgi:hypothetical protein